MNKTNELLNQVKEKEKIESDYALAKSLGIKPNRISNYRCGFKHADDKMAVMLADKLGLDRLKTIAEINSERAKTPADKKFWKQLANAAGFFVAVLGLTSSFLPSLYIM